MVRQYATPLLPRVYINTCVENRLEMVMVNITSVNWIESLYSTRLYGSYPTITIKHLYFPSTNIIILIFIFIYIFLYSPFLFIVNAVIFSVLFCALDSGSPCLYSASQRWPGLRNKDSGGSILKKEIMKRC